MIRPPADNTSNALRLITVRASKLVVANTRIIVDMVHASTIDAWIRATLIKFCVKKIAMLVHDILHVVTFIKNIADCRLKIDFAAHLFDLTLEE